MDQWEWQIGVLDSIGYCAWQETDGKMRRITHILVGPQGLGFSKSVLHLMQNNCQEIPHLDLVLHSVPCDQDLAKDLERVWEGSMIKPVNGRIRLT